MKLLPRPLIAAAIIATIFLSYSLPAAVSAAQLTSRTLTLGSSAASATTSHEFDFTVATTDDVGSIIFEYCTTASGVCTAPTDLDVDGVSLSAQTGATGFALDATATTANEIVIDKTPASIAAATAVSYTFTGADNPSTTNQTFFVRITTTDAVDGGGSVIDTGVVASSTAEQITLTGTMDESLTFCTGTSGISTSSCAAATGSSVSFGTFSPSSTNTGVSQIGVGTNAASGYSITINGSTLTSGGNTVTALAAQAASVIGSEQFGLNLRDNATPDIGTDPDGAGDATPTANYNTVDQFRFVTGDSVASDAEADAFRRFHAAYIVNVATNTEPGTYQATMTFICTATF